MPANVPVPDKSAGDVFTEAMWDSYIKDNINKLLNLGHRVLTVAQFGALTGLEDGDEVYLEVDSSAGVQWHLRYHLSSTKWRFLGGPPMVAEVTTGESPGSTGAYVALTTAGPTVALPIAADYDVDLNVDMTITVGTNARMSYDIGGTGAVDADAVVLISGGGFGPGSFHRERRKTGLTAVSLTSKYKSGSTASTFANRRMRVQPVKT